MRQGFIDDKKSDDLATIAPVLALPIFPGRHQPSIFGRDELNYRVRNGNGWTLILISTNSVSGFHRKHPYYRASFTLCQEELVTRTGFEPMLTA